LGVLGHSFGGAAAAEACQLDDRLRAGACVDGGLWKTPADVDGSGPFLQLFGEHPEYVLSCAEAVSAKYFATAEYCAADREATVGAWQALHERSKPGRSVLVLGARHASFIDWPLLPLWRISMARRGLGTPEPGVVWRVASDYLLDFFGEHLRGQLGSRFRAASSDSRVSVGSPSALFRAA
jgi:pimeloyl-ACP methyl ester carboxylesterase